MQEAPPVTCHSDSVAYRARLRSTGRVRSGAPLSSSIVSVHSMRTRVQLDLSLLPDATFFESRSIFRTLPESLEAALVSFPEAAERARSAAMFAESPDDKTEPWRAAAFLRAAVGELYSLPTAFSVDLGARWRADPYGFGKSADPLLHLSLLLRHLSFHVSTLPVAKQEIQTTWRDHSFPFNISVISDLTESHVFRLREARSNYDAATLRAALRWFCESQKHWGAGYLFKIAVQRYCEAVMSRHPARQEHAS